MNFTAVESGVSGARGKHCMYVAYFMVNELPVFCIHTQTNIISLLGAHGPFLAALKD